MSGKSNDRQLSLIFPIKHSTSEMYANDENMTSQKHVTSPQNRSSAAKNSSAGSRLMSSEVDSLNNRLKILNAENDELLDKLSETKRARERREREFADETEALRNKVDVTESKYSESKKYLRDVKEKLQEYDEMQNVIADLRKRLSDSERGRIAAEQHEEEMRRRLEYEFSNRDAEGLELRREKSEMEHHLENVRSEYDVIVTELKGKIKRMTEKQRSDLNVISELKAINEKLTKDSGKVSDSTLLSDTTTERKELKRRLEVEFKARQQALLEIEKLKEELEQKSKDAADEITRLSDSLFERERQLEEAERQLKEQQYDRVGPNQEQINNLEETLSRKETQLEDAMNRLKDPESEHRILTLRSKVQELEQMLARKKAEHSDEIERLKDESERKKEQLDVQLKELSLVDLTDNNASDSSGLLEVNRELEENIRLKDKELQLLRRCFESCQDDLESVRNELRIAMLARDTASEQHSAADQQLLKTIQLKDDELKIANEALKQSKKELKRISENISNDISSSDKNDSSAEIERLENKVVKKSNKIKALKDELKKRDVERVSVSSTSATTIQLQESEIRSAKDTLSNSLKKLDECQKDLATCQQDLASCRKEFEGCTREKDQYQTELNNCKKELELLKRKQNDQNNHENDNTTSKKDLLELTERNGKLERALVRLKLENDDLKAGNENKNLDAMKRLVEEKESLIADLMKEVNKLRSSVLSNAEIDGRNPEKDKVSSNNNRSNVAYDILQNKYEDILSAHRKLLEEITGLRADSVKDKRRTSLPNAHESDNLSVRNELLHAKKKLESSAERIAQLERWLDEIYSDPEIGLAPMTRRSYVVGSGIVEPICLPLLNQSSAADNSYRSPGDVGGRKKKIAAKAKPAWDSRPKKN